MGVTAAEAAVSGDTPKNDVSEPAQSTGVQEIGRTGLESRVMEQKTAVATKPSVCVCVLSRFSHV